MNSIVYFSASNSLSTSLRADIESTRSCFFVLVLACTAIVAIGVVMEELVEHREDKNHPWVVKPEWHHTLARIGWVLVIVGVIGEGVFEGATSWVDNILQDFNNTLLGMATEQAGNAANQSVVDFLHKHHWEATQQYLLLPKKISPNDIDITIGLYPAHTFVVPPGEQEFALGTAKEMEEISKTREQMDKVVDESNLKHLSPEQAAQYMAAKQRREKADKDWEEKEYGPCRVADPFENPLGVIR